MKPKPEKCKVMRFSFLRNPPPKVPFTINGIRLEWVDSQVLLGIAIQANLKWDRQVQTMVSRAARRLYILSVLKKNGANVEDLLIYRSYIRPLLEIGSPVWGSSLTKAQVDELERVQKGVLRCIAFPNVLSYNKQLILYGLTSLELRRNELLLRFGESLLQSDRYRNFLPPTRQSQSRTRLQLRNSKSLDIPFCRTQRYRLSTIPSLSVILNSSL